MGNWRIDRFLTSKGRLNMGHKNKYLLNIYEVILMIIILPVVFYVSLKLFFEPLNKNSPGWFHSFWGIILIIGFNALWLIAMKLWPLKLFRLKVYVTLVVLVVSLAILICWIMLNALSNAMH
jgi:hypothetical protein